MLNTHTASKEKLPWPAEKCTPLEAVGKKRLPKYKGADKGDLTIVGELNKLASNAALGRNFAGVHFRSDGDQGLAIEQAAGVRPQVGAQLVHPREVRWDDHIEITASGWDWKRGKPGYPLFSPDPLPDTEPPADPRLRTEL
eukprot:scaffold11695_cov70-Phaeocystis_antarctica.AAC.4